MGEGATVTQALLGNSRVILQQLWMILHRNAQQHEAVQHDSKGKQVVVPAEHLQQR